MYKDDVQDNYAIHWYLEVGSSISPGALVEGSEAGGKMLLTGKGALRMPHVRHHAMPALDAQIITWDV